MSLELHDNEKHVDYCVIHTMPWICHCEQSACHVVYYSRVYAQLIYVSFQPSESGHFVGVTRRVVEGRFYLVIPSSLFLRYHTLAFLQSACLLSADYSEELCSHRSTFHGLDPWCRLRNIET